VQNLRTCVLQGLPAFDGGTARCGNDDRRGTGGEHRSSHGRPQGAVDDDLQGIRSRAQPHCELWVVGENRAHADQHGVVIRTQLVGENTRLRTAYPARIPDRRGDSAVQRLSVFERDEGPSSIAGGKVVVQGEVPREILARIIQTPRLPMIGCAWISFGTKRWKSVCAGGGRVEQQPRYCRRWDQKMAGVKVET